MKYERNSNLAHRHPNEESVNLIDCVKGDRITLPRGYSSKHAYTRVIVVRVKLIMKDKLQLKFHHHWGSDSKILKVNLPRDMVVMRRVEPVAEVRPAIIVPQPSKEEVVATMVAAVVAKMHSPLWIPPIATPLPGPHFNPLPLRIVQLDKDLNDV